MSGGTLAGRLLIALLCVASTAGCSVREDAAPEDASVVAPPAGTGLQAVSLPDLGAMEAPAREQMQARLSTLRATIKDVSAPRERTATAYGEMGKLLMAATYLDAAESCYLNPGMHRGWPSRFPDRIGF